MSSTKARTTLGVLVAALAGILVLALPAAASARDRNHDKIPDRWEKRFHLSLKVNQANRDQDRDKLTNRQEFRAKLNPRKSDTNGDGTPDGQENAGTIATFDGTNLTINLFAGGSVSGIVDSNTEITCDGQSGTDEPDGDNNDTGDDTSGDTGDDTSGDTGDDSSGSGGDNSLSRGPVGSDDESGDTSDDDTSDDDTGDGSTCTTADLVPQAVVHEADLHIGSSGAVFDQIDLVSAP